MLDRRRHGPGNGQVGGARNLVGRSDLSMDALSAESEAGYVGEKVVLEVCLGT